MRKLLLVCLVLAGCSTTGMTKDQDDAVTAIKADIDQRAQRGEYVTNEAREVAFANRVVQVTRAPLVVELLTHRIQVFRMVDQGSMSVAEANQSIKFKYDELTRRAQAARTAEYKQAIDNIFMGLIAVGAGVAAVQQANPPPSPPPAPVMCRWIGQFWVCQ